MCSILSVLILAGKGYCSARMPMLDSKFSCKELASDIWDLGGSVLVLGELATGQYL